MLGKLARAARATVLVALGACHDPISPRAASGRYLIRLRAGAPAALSARLAHARAVTVGSATTMVATLSADELAAVRGDAAVAGVEADAPIRGAGIQLAAPWGLDRIDQPSLPLAGTYVYPASGGPVTVYVLDSGVDVTHPEFDGRAEAGADFIGTGVADCNGHGTHVAGVVAGRTYGVAKDARVVSVRVLDCELNGTVSQAIAALGWVVRQKEADPETPAVANLSLEGSIASGAFDQAVAAAAEAGVTVVVAAGNAGGDACAASPSRAPAAIAVAASDRGDALAPFSNRGACVALVAPGVDVPSAWVGEGAQTRWLSGTSAAAPAVAGAAALYLARHPAATPAQVRAALVANATPGALVGVPAGTPNRVLGIGFLRAGGAGTLPNTRPVGAPHVERRCTVSAACTASVTPVL